ncbi:MAG: thiamine-phosphate kinase, partial [Alistipes sp.]|nr:thiamine-phosphate kinase [Alistipes sp.]
MSQRKRTEIAELGEFGLIDHLTRNATTSSKHTLRGVGDDAAVVAAGRDDATVISTDTLLEGIDFDLTYFPLKHLGYKAGVVGVSDILAMNALPEQVM